MFWSKMDTLNPLISNIDNMMPTIMNIYTVISNIDTHNMFNSNMPLIF